MKQYLLPENGQFYKANLHCHTNLSDGALSPEEIKDVYKNAGYSIVAYTDHELLFPQSHLADADFLPLNGVELDLLEPNHNGVKGTGRCYHFCCIALEPDNVYTPCYHSTMYTNLGTAPHRHLAKRIPGSVDRIRDYTPQCFNSMVAEAKANGFFVTYNHPDYSLEDQFIWSQYEGMDAMEIYNHASMVMGYEDYVPRVYDAMLRQGKRLYCLATDDNHNYGTPDTRTWDSLGGFVMIKADRLEYRTVTRALQDGHFYASNGPAIHSLWIEDGEVHIQCSEAEKIFMTTARRRRAMRWAEEGETVTEAVFAFEMNDIFIRLTVLDHRGRFAETNAFFVDQCEDMPDRAPLI